MLQYNRTCVRYQEARLYTARSGAIAAALAFIGMIVWVAAAIREAKAISRER